MGQRLKSQVGLFYKASVQVCSLLQLEKQQDEIRGSVTASYPASMCWNWSRLAPKVNSGEFHKPVVKNSHHQTVNFINLKLIKIY